MTRRYFCLWSHFAVALLLALGACGLPTGLSYESDGGKLTLRTTPWPPAARVLSQFEVALERFETPPAALTLVLGMAEMDHPDTVITLSRQDGRVPRYRGSGRIDHGGRWEFTVTSPDGAVLASFDVEVAP